MLLSVIAVLAVGLTAGCKKEPAAPEGGEQAAAPGGEAGAPAAQPTEVKLTKDIVTNWIASARDEKVNDILSSVEQEQPEEQTPGAEEDLSKLRERILDLGANAQLNDAIKAHGFDSAEQWAKVTVRIMAGLVPAMRDMALESLVEAGVSTDSQEYQELKADLEQEVEKVGEQLAELTDEEKQIVKDMAEEIMSALEGTEQPPAEQPAAPGE